jgi:uncharacterized membrane protein required for colicin V production
MEIIKKFTLIDFLFLLLALRIIYIALSKGILNEILKTVGILFSSLIAFHYYPIVGKDIEKGVPEFIKNSSYFLSFFLILSFFYVVFYFLRKIITVLFKKEGISLDERMVSLFIGGFRFAFLLSTIIFFLHLFPSQNKYLYKSRSYKLFKNVAPKIYLVSFEVYNRFNREEKLNKEVKRYYEAKGNLSPGNKERD